MRGKFYGGVIMDTNRMTTLMLAGCQAVLLWSLIPQTVLASEAADPSRGTVEVHPLQLAQQELTPGKWPGEFGTGPGSQRMMAPGRGPASQRMTGGPMRSSPMAMLNAIGTLDLSDEQRSTFDAISKGLNSRLQEITGRINAESEKMRKLQEEQMRIGKTLNDLRGHMMQATIDAANHAEELLTDEQRQAMIDQGRHVMMQPRSLPFAESQGGKSE
jgi:hypothetical protein